MSTWITLAFEANSSNFPVTRSSKRAPTAINKSHSVTAKLAYMMHDLVDPIPKGYVYICTFDGVKAYLQQEVEGPKK